EGIVVNASPCAEVVARSATWLGRVLSCVCAQSIEDDSRPSFDLTPAQYLFVDVALVPEKLKRIPLQVKHRPAQNVRSPGFSKPPHGFSLPSGTRTEEVVSTSSHLR
nr:hypothetical protein [Tanacetum cinerariifolium]